MTKIDDFFGETSEPPHPRLRDWTRRLAEPNASAFLEVFQPRGVFGQGKPQLCVQFSSGGEPTHLDEVLWDDDLNSGLIELKVKAVSPEQEAERFSLGLRAATRKVEREFGDGYFNAVLAELVQESDLTQYKEIADVMRYAHAGKPYRVGGSLDRYTTCRDLIADAIGGRAKELTRGLGYTQEAAKEILTSALARFLDERFAVSSRREFGML